MTIPLIVLAVLSAIAGMIGVPEIMGGHHELEHFLAPVFEPSHKLLEEHHLSHSVEFILMGVSVVLALASMLFAYFRYAKKGHVPVEDTAERSFLAKLSYNKFYVDELYDAIIRKPLDALSVFFYKVVDRAGIDGIVNGLGKGSIEASKGLRLMQAGNVGFYIFMMVVGIIAILLYSLTSL